MKMIYGGGGSFQRTLSAFYKRLYYTHLAMLESHTLPTPGAGVRVQGVHWLLLTL